MTTIDLKKLEKSVSVIEGSDYNGYFTFLLEHARHQGFLQSAYKKYNGLNFNQLTKRLFAIHSDLMSIVTIIFRIDYEFTFNNKDSSYNLWRYYSSLDIESIFRKYRTIFDNISQLIKSIFNGTNSLPNSFNDLYNKIDNYNTIPMSFKNIIKKVDWFYAIKTIRDDIEHYSAEINVNRNNDNELLFTGVKFGTSLTNLPEKYILPPLKMEMEGGFINFYNFVGIYIGYLIWFIEEICRLIYTIFKDNCNYKQCRLAHPGFYLIRNFIEKIIYRNT